jgi:hypothetical protein
MAALYCASTQRLDEVLKPNAAGFREDSASGIEPDAHATPISQIAISKEGRGERRVAGLRERYPLTLDP